MDSYSGGSRLILVFAALLLAVVFLFACDDLFINDGDPDRGMNLAGGYYYFIDNTSYTLLMMDARLKVVKSWDTKVLFGETAVQGITSDGLYLWLSAAGTQDKIIQIDISGDIMDTLRTLDAPPERRGTIRDISWDGQNIWAVNSGSTTYSIPPTLYKLDPSSGTVLEEHVVPTPEPRGMTYVGANADIYNRGIPIGLYYGDSERDTIYRYLTEKVMFETAYPSPRPPRGEGYVFPVGLTYDGTDLWVVNSSDLAGDHLFRVDRVGTATEFYELPYKKPGPIVWSPNDLSLPHPPVVTAVSPNSAARGAELTVAIIGEYFRSGATVSFGNGIVTTAEVTFVSNERLTVPIEVLSNAEFGSRDVTVTNPDGQSGVGLGVFTVPEFDPNDGYFYYTDAGNRVMRKIKISDFSIVQSWDISGIDGGSPQGLTFDGSYLWMSAGGTADRVMQIEIDGTSISVLRQFDAPLGSVGTIRELDFLGDDLYILYESTDRIYIVDSLTGSVTDSIPAPATEGRGLVFANGDLYTNDRTSDSVYRYDFGTEAWTALFATPVPPGGTESNRYPTGMTWDGINFWIVNSTGDYDYIFQVTIDGAVLRTYELPDRGTVTQPTGIVFTRN